MHAVRGTAVWDQIDPVLAMVIEGAATTSAVDLVRAEDACHTLNLRLVELFHDVRLLITPTVAAAAAAPFAGGIGDDQRDGRLQLGQVHLSVQYDPLAGGIGLRRSDRRRACRWASSWSGLNTPTWWCLRSAAALEAALGFDALPPLLPRNCRRHCGLTCAPGAQDLATRLPCHTCPAWPLSPATGVRAFSSVG